MNAFDSSAAQAGRVPTRGELVASALALHPLLRQYSGWAEAERRPAPEVTKALAEAGFFRLMKPVRFGGYEADLRTVTEVLEALGRGDGSAAWLVGVATTASWMAGLASEQAQLDLFGPDPDSRVAGGSNPSPARAVEGGYVISGRWAYSSGAHHATWATMGALITDDSGHVVDVVLALAPASELGIEETWQTVGMRGTGSHTFVADDVFVPTHRTFSMGRMARGIWPVPTDEAMYRLPLGPLATLLLAAPLLGLGQAALDLVVAKAHDKGVAHTFFQHQSDSVGVQIQIAEASLKIRTARLHLHAVADEIDAATSRGEQVDFGARAAYRAQCGHAAQQVLEALNILLNVHGAGSFAENNPLQQYWRDANTAARHGSLNATVGYEIHGKALLGIDEPVSPLI
ncbi:acyl-CoA dehydrogenase family protein [Streptomyces sp. NPDC026672]|uniref:acyl-CoA dehydrogenase family protein n=1 Tax=unclassified Streptomyces TaxID=2593676 RepID=UPI003400D73F